MFSLEEILGAVTGASAREQISQNLGAESSAVGNAIQIALPAILGGLAKNAGDPTGAESLSSVLEEDHDGSLLESLSGYLQGGVPAPGDASRQTDGTGILGHILGGASGNVVQEISNQTGLNAGQAANLLITLAPIVMAYLGKQKQEQGFDAGGLSDLLTGKVSEAKDSGNPLIDLATGMLDKDHDGSALDDLASMAAGYFMK